MYFDIVGDMDQIETIAEGRSIRELSRLRKFYGQARWRKRKGIASIRLADGTICKAEIHWYEGYGVGRKEFKLKRILEV